MMDQLQLALLALDTDLSPALRLLPDRTPVPPRLLAVAADLERWQCPAWLVRLAVLSPALEHGRLAPAAAVAALGDDASEAAAALAATGRADPRHARQQNPEIGRLFTLAYRSPAAGLLKLLEVRARADRAHDALLARELELLGPAARLALRFGMWELRNRLLDHAARLADPHLYQQARDLLEQSRPERLALFEDVRENLRRHLRQAGVHADIGRKSRPLHRIIDDGLDSIRGTTPWAEKVLVNVETVPDCYRALGAIHAAYRVFGASVRDYVGDERDNGYQAITTQIAYAAAGREVKIAIQIATPEMERFNTEGLIAHLAGTPVPNNRPVWWADRRRWLAADAGQSGEIYVFTPAAEAIFVPPRATVLDFAVRVHSDLGVYCRGALVNGVRVPPGEPLVCGDVCEVLIDEHAGVLDPRLRDLATTPLAKSQIGRALKRSASGASRGRDIFRAALARRLEPAGLHADEAQITEQVAALCRARGYAVEDAFYRAVARGEAAPDEIVRMVIEALLVPRLDTSALPPDALAADSVRLAGCCWPHPDEPVVAALVNGGRRLVIHRAGCARVRGTAYPLAWRPAPEQVVLADVLYEGWDRPGLVHRLTGMLEQLGGLNIRSIEGRVPEPSLARVRMTIEAPDQATVDAVQRALHALPERRHVEVRAVTLLDAATPVAGPLQNLYRPQPVGAWPLFVGRDHEVRAIVNQLDSGDGGRHILLRGPKRIGKSSLLEHLSRYHLGEYNVPATLDLQSLPTDELRIERLLARLAEMLAQKAGQRLPLPSVRLLAHDPVRHFAAFLEALRERQGVDPFVVLLDELGVVRSRLRDTPAASEFFDQWRALLNDERIYRHISLIAVLPDLPAAQALDAGGQERIGELGLPVRLSVLGENDVRDLITAPIKAHLEYLPADLDRLVAATGGHPYYAHLVCSKVVGAVQARQRRIGLLTSRQRQVVPGEIVDDALADVLAHNDAFYHVLVDSSPTTAAVLRAVAARTSDAERLVTPARVRARLRRMGQPAGDDVLEAALDERPDLLVRAEGGIGIRVGLVARWLRRHAV
jgi:(p)ppGpp synthase/HD superfamily hydrolase/DNA polymerase III delta prime subunit